MAPDPRDKKIPTLAIRRRPAVGQLTKDVIWVPIDVLQANGRNARMHSKTQVRQIANSIEKLGFLNPILIDENDVVIAGHGRLEGAKLLKASSVPVLRIDGLSDQQKRAYVIADNRLAEKAGWDRGMLALELGELATLLPDLDLTLTGFVPAEIDMLLADHVDVDVESDVPIVLQTNPVTERGDLWRLGRHRVFCGDAQRRDAFERLMGDERARMVFADPPYNVPIKGHVMGRGQHQHAEFAFAAGEMSNDEFVGFLRTSFEHAANVSMPGAVHYICMDWRHIDQLITAGRSVYADMLNLCVWAKTNAGQGSFYRSAHEMIGVFRTAGGPHQNNIALGKYGRNRSNVWTYPGVNSFGRGRSEALADHPTVKPIALVCDAIRDTTTRGELILDPFMGSGTTLLAANKIGRRGYGIEYDPRYVDVTIRRWQDATGQDAILDGTATTYAEVAAARGPTGSSDGGDNVDE